MGSTLRNEYQLGYEETELRLSIGLPGAGNECETPRSNGKRGFDETVDLKLNLSTSSQNSCVSEENDDKNNKIANQTKSIVIVDPVARPPTKAQVVGWPPVRSFRKNLVSVQKTSSVAESEKSAVPAAFVKVSVDGAPYLRKVDLKLYQSYQELSDALGKMFSSFTINGSCGSEGLKDFMNESKLIDLLNGSEYVPTYEDKDGDWMLVGDVPWEMFVESCKRLRIMKGSEAIGLAPRAVEKRKSRS